MTSVREPQARRASVTTTRRLTDGSAPASRARPELDYELRHWLRQQRSDLLRARVREQGDEPDCERAPVPGVCFHERCGQPFDPTHNPNGGGANKKFCSDKCRKRHNNDRFNQYRKEGKQ